LGAIESRFVEHVSSHKDLLFIVLAAMPENNLRLGLRWFFVRCLVRNSPMGMAFNPAFYQYPFYSIIKGLILLLWS
jgi:hypothetical protein